jgi:hypothetical protein
MGIGLRDAMAPSAIMGIDPCDPTAPSAIMGTAIFGRLGTRRLGTAFLCILL